MSSITDIVHDNGFTTFSENGEVAQLPTWYFLQEYGVISNIDDVKVGNEYFYTANGSIPMKINSFYIIIYNKRGVKFHGQEICETQDGTKNGLNIDNDCITKYEIRHVFLNSENRVIQMNKQSRSFILYRMSSKRYEDWKKFVPSEEIINNSNNNDKAKTILLELIKKEEEVEKVEEVEKEETGGSRCKKLRKTTKRKTTKRKTTKRKTTKRKTNKRK